MPSPTEPESRARLEAARVARLATVRADGSPHAVPICFALVADTLYMAVDAKPKRTQTLQRVENARATGRASVVVDHYEEDWARLWWVRADGAARVLDTGEERERAIDALAAKYEQYRVARPTGPVLAVDVERVAGWSAS